MSTPSESAVAAGGSASAVYAETDTGWHVFKVVGYSKFKGIGVGRHVKSSTFTVGGHSWYITFHPDGFRVETANWICLGLSLEDQNPTSGDFEACCTMSLLDQFGEPVKSDSLRSTFYSTDRCSHGLAFTKFIRSKELESSFVKEDSFQIRCDVTVLQEIHRRTIIMSSQQAPQPPTDLQRHLGDLLATGVGGDVTFEVNGELFTAHRNVLAARSSVFMAQLFGPLKEKQTKHIRIQDMDARVFKIMLRFVYTDALPDSEIEGDEKVVIAQHLLVVADRYNLQRLKLISEEMLCSSVDISTAATTLVLADQHACQGLKAACFEFLKRPGNLKAVMASDGFQHLKSSCPSFLEEMLAVFADPMLCSNNNKEIKKRWFPFSLTEKVACCTKKICTHVSGLAQIRK